MLYFIINDILIIDTFVRKKKLNFNGLIIENNYQIIIII